MNRTIGQVCLTVALLVLAPLAMAAPVVNVHLGAGSDTATDIFNGNIDNAIAAVDANGTVILVDAGDYQPVVYTGDKSTTITSTVAARIVSQSTVPAVRAGTTSATAAVSLTVKDVDVWTSASAASAAVPAVSVAQSTEALTLTFAGSAIENAGTATGRGEALVITGAAIPATAGALNVNFLNADVSTTGSSTFLARINVTPATLTQINVSATDSTFHHNGSGGTNNGFRMSATNKILVNNSFSFVRCSLQVLAGTTGHGFLIQTNQLAANNTLNFEDTLVRIPGGGTNAHCILFQANSNNANTANNNVTVDRCTLVANGNTNTQGRGVRVNVGNAATTPTTDNTLTVVNCVVVVPGQTLNGNNRASNNQSNALSSEGRVTVTVDHNTLVAQTTFKGHSGVWHNSPDPLVLRNNIFWNFGGESSPHYTNKGGFGVFVNQQAADLTASGNVVAGDPNDTDSDIAPTSGDIVPLAGVFVDEPNDDFHLTSTSPALGNFAVTSDIGVTVDREGSIRPNPNGTLPDAGALESIEVPVTLRSFRIE